MPSDNKLLIEAYKKVVNRSNRDDRAICMKCDKGYYHSKGYCPHCEREEEQLYPDHPDFEDQWKELERFDSII